MEVVHFLMLSDEQKEQLRLLWNKEYPASIAHNTLESLENYLNNLKDLNHYLLVDNETIFGWYFDFEREGERQFAIIISSLVKGKGYGKQFLELAKSKNVSLSAWVVDSNEFRKADGKLYKSPIDFYANNGFDIGKERWDSDILKTVKISWSKND